VLIGFSNSIRGAKRLTAPKALSDSDNDISCHARKYGMDGTRFPMAIPAGGRALALSTGIIPPDVDPVYTNVLFRIAF
jgi:hypothetical protein